MAVGRMIPIEGGKMLAILLVVTVLVILLVSFIVMLMLTEPKSEK